MANEKMHTTVSVVVIDAGRVLMIRERTGKKRGCWNLPTGRVKYGESLTQAARREVREEALCDVQLTGIIGIYTYVSPTNKHVFRYVFLAKKIDSDDAGSNMDEVQDITWVEVDRVSQLSPIWARECALDIMHDMQAKHPLPLSILHERLNPSP